MSSGERRSTAHTACCTARRSAARTWSLLQRSAPRGPQPPLPVSAAVMFLIVAVTRKQINLLFSILAEGLRRKLYALFRPSMGALVQMLIREVQGMATPAQQHADSMKTETS